MPKSRISIREYVTYIISPIAIPLTEEALNLEERVVGYGFPVAVRDPTASPLPLICTACTQRMAVATRYNLLYCARICLPVRYLVLYTCEFGY